MDRVAWEFGGGLDGGGHLVSRWNCGTGDAGDADGADEVDPVKYDPMNDADVVAGCLLSWHLCLRRAQQLCLWSGDIVNERIKGNSRRI